MRRSEQRLIDAKYYDENRYADKEIYSPFTNMQSSFQQYRIKNVLQLYTPNRNERVLDMGCGCGTFCIALAPLCKEVTGVDFSRKSIELCKKLLTKNKYKNNNKLKD